MSMHCHAIFTPPPSNCKQHAQVWMWVHTRSMLSFCGLTGQHLYKTTTKKNSLSTPQIISKQLRRRERKAGCCGNLSNNFLFSSLPPAKAKWKLLPRDASALNALNYNQMLSLSLLKIRKLIIGHIFKACDASTLFLFHFRNKTSDNLSSNITNTPPR